LGPALLDKLDDLQSFHFAHVELGSEHVWCHVDEGHSIHSSLFESVCIMFQMKGPQGICDIIDGHLLRFFGFSDQLAVFVFDLFHSWSLNVVVVFRTAGTGAGTGSMMVLISTWENEMLGRVVCVSRGTIQVGW